MPELVQTIAIFAIPVLLAITLHEAAHGYVARFSATRLHTWRDASLSTRCDTSTRSVPWSFRW